MVDLVIIKQWSTAFFQLAISTNTVKKYRDEVIIITNLMEQFPEIINIGASNLLALSEKQQFIKLVFQDFSLYTLNFLLLLATKKHFSLVKAILKDFRDQCNSYCGIDYGIVYSVVWLTKVQIDQLQTKIAKIIKNNKIELINKIDNNLIGGIKVKIKNKIFDYSIKSQIEQLKVKLNLLQDQDK